MQDIFEIEQTTVNNFLFIAAMNVQYNCHYHNKIETMSFSLQYFF